MPPAQDAWPTLEELARQESEIVLPALTEQVAYDLGRAATDAAWERELPIVVGIWRGGHQLFHSALPGSTRDNDQWLQRKGRVVARFEHSSLYMGQLCRDAGTTLETKFLLPVSRYAAHGGALPLRVEGPGSWAGWACRGCRSSTTTPSSSGSFANTCASRPQTSRSRAMARPSPPSPAAHQQENTGDGLFAAVTG